MKVLLLLAVLFAFPTTAAHAEKRVDWSQYLEKPGDRPSARKTPVVAEPEAKPAKKAKATKKRAAKATSTKAKRKPGRRR